MLNFMYDMMIYIYINGRVIPLISSQVEKKKTETKSKKREESPEPPKKKTTVSKKKDLPQPGMFWGFWSKNMGF